MNYQPVSCVEKTSCAKEKLVEEVLKSFNTWRFKRSQPSDAGLLQDFVAKAVVSGNPVPFVLYWGKGFRSQTGASERACIGYLSDLGRKIADVYEPGAEFDILYTDTHAALNGHAAGDVEEYLGSLRADCGEEFAVRRLSDVVAASRVRQGEVPPVAPEEAAAMIAKLVGCAEKWYRGHGRPADGAARYYWMNMRERVAVERIFPKSIFVTFNGSEMRPIFPSNLPVFYMYSIKKGTSVKPWFMDEPGAGAHTSSEGAGAQAVSA
ncbi:MAG: hypothetical protein KJ622_16400 [Alphaproteobacteria bacterium]|nr:hypothetical protein [Alphaproteobacteria bacterium]